MIGVLSHSGLVRAVKRILMELVVGVQVICYGAGAVYGGNLGREVGGTLSGLRWRKNGRRVSAHHQREIMDGRNHEKRAGRGGKAPPAAEEEGVKKQC
jgi:hypothetical protein